MPRFFFHRTDGFTEVDTVGTDLPDAAAAKMEAVRFAGETLRSNPHRLAEDDSLAIEVSDDAGLILFSVLVMAVESPAVSVKHRTRNHTTGE